MAMDQTDVYPNEDCGRALEAHTRLLDGQALSHAERLQLDAHVADCKECAQSQLDLSSLEHTLNSALNQIRVSPGFAARVLKTLPKQATTIPQLPRVFGAPPQRRWWVAAVAAIALLVTGSLLYVGQVNHQNSANGPLTVHTGILLGENGKAVKRVQRGASYTAQETAVLPVTHHSVVKIERGSQIAMSGTEANPGVELKSGDLYASAQDEKNPLRVSCSTFHTDFFGGDFFIAEAGAGGDDPRGVVIVFTGRAEIMPRSAQPRVAGDAVAEAITVPLRAGQVFMSLGADEYHVSQTMELSEAVVRLRENPPELVDVPTLRRDYQKRIQGYQTDLQTLETLLGTVKDTHHLAELRERKQRVLAYCEAHQRKLETLVQPMPLDQIERGVRGRSDPARWM